MSVGSVTDITGKSIKPFTTIRYVTKDGENCIATKNNGVVTIQGDKNGIRQMPLDDFMQKELLQNVKPLGAQTLERTPQEDTVSFSGKEEETKKNSNTKKGLLAALGVAALAATAFVLTRGKTKIKPSVVNDARQSVQELASETSRLGEKLEQPVSETVENIGQHMHMTEAELEAKINAEVDAFVDSIFNEVESAEAAASTAIKAGKETSSVVEEASNVANEAATDVVQAVKPPKDTLDIMREVFGGGGRELKVDLKTTAAGAPKVKAAGEKVVLESLGDDIAQAETGLIEKEVQKGEAAAKELFGVESSADNMIEKEVTSVEESFGKEVSEANKGKYGQDIYDPYEPMNEYDPRSPHYKRKQEEDDLLAASALLYDDAVTGSRSLFEESTSLFDDALESSSSYLDDAYTSFADDALESGSSFMDDFGEMF